MKKLLKNDAFQFLSLGVLVILVVYGLNAAKGRIIFQTVYLTFFDVLDIIVAVSIFIGLFQVWVKPQTIVKLLGKGDQESKVSSSSAPSPCSWEALSSRYFHS